MDLLVTVKEVKGHCPVHKVGDSFTLKACYQLVSEIPVCMHGLASVSYTHLTLPTIYSV